MKKECFKCNTIKNLEEFYKHPSMLDGRVNKCKECNKSDVRKNYITNNVKIKEYDKYRHRYSITRLFGHRYSGIKSRCKGVTNRKYTVTGTKFLSKEEWNKWCYEEKNYKLFLEIYNNWVQNNFSEKLAPSVDRINSKLGYTYKNIQWLSKSDNCKKYNK